MKNEKGATIIQSLDRGLRLLEEIGKSRIPVSLKGLASVLGIDRSSIFRLLSTLENRGYLEREEETKRYKLGYKILELSGELYVKIRIAEESRTYLEELASKTQEAAHLAIYSNGEVLFIEKADSTEVIAANMNIGRREPLHCTALGKVLLTFLSEETLNSILSQGLKKWTENTIVEKDKLVQELKSVTEKGYAIDDEEYKIGMRCIASPIYDYRGKIIAAMGISGPASRIMIEKMEVMTETVKEVAARFSLRLGYNPKYRV